MILPCGSTLFLEILVSTEGYDHPLEFYHKNSFILELWLKKYCVGDEIQREIITETCNLYL